MPVNNVKVCLEVGLTKPLSVHRWQEGMVMCLLSEYIHHSRNWGNKSKTVSVASQRLQTRVKMSVNLGKEKHNPCCPGLDNYYLK